MASEDNSKQNIPEEQNAQKALEAMDKSFDEFQKKIHRIKKQQQIVLKKIRKRLDQKKVKDIEEALKKLS